MRRLEDTIGIILARALPKKVSKYDAANLVETANELTDLFHKYWKLTGGKRHE